MNELCRIYYFKANCPVTAHDGDNKVRMLGTNASWTEIGTRDYDVKIKNLCAARNAAGNLAYCVFTSEGFTKERGVNEVFHSLLGASYPPGFYESF